jgi:beta-lactamase class D
MTTGAVEINDSYRAENKSNYSYNANELKKVIDQYKMKTYCEEIDYVNKELRGID